MVTYLSTLWYHQTWQGVNLIEVIEIDDGFPLSHVGLPECDCFLKPPSLVVPSGKLSHNYGKLSLLIGKSTINGQFSIVMLVYQRVNSISITTNNFDPVVPWFSVLSRRYAVKLLAIVEFRRRSRFSMGRWARKKSATAIS